MQYHNSLHFQILTIFHALFSFPFLWQSTPDISKAPEWVKPALHRLDVDGLRRDLPKGYGHRMPDGKRQWWENYISNLDELTEVCILKISEWCTFIHIATFLTPKSYMRLIFLHVTKGILFACFKSLINLLLFKKKLTPLRKPYNNRMIFTLNIVKCFPIPDKSLTENAYLWAWLING